MTSSAADTCASLDACIDRMRMLAKGRDLGGLSPPDTALIQRLLQFDDVVPRVMPYLADQDHGIAEFAAAVLRDVRHIDPKYLPEIKAGLDRDLGWLPPALGRMDDDAAAREAVQRYLAASTSPHNQEAYAVRLCGKRAVPFIIEAARCAGGCPRGSHELLVYLVREMPPDVRASAADELMDIVLAADTPPNVARGVLAMIAVFDVDGLRFEKDLIALNERKPGLRDSIDDALVGIHSERAGQVFAHRLRMMRVDGVEARFLLQNIGATGRPAQAAGPEIVRLLDDPDWVTRVAAARALGFIGFQPAVPSLVALLDSPEDVRLNWVAAEALGQIGDPAASEALRKVAATHWYPPVRQSAARALTYIAKPGSYAAESESGLDDIRSDFFAYESIGDESLKCHRPLSAAARESRAEAKRGVRNARQLRKLAYPTIVVGYGPAEGAEPDGDGVISMTSDTMVRHDREIRQVPEVALRVDGGWIAGSDRGEWGGELVFLGDDKSRQRLLDENVLALYALGNRFVAVTGLSHMIINEGAVYELTRDPGGSWKASAWRVLPGAPRATLLTEHDELLIDVDESGVLSIAADGAMRLVPCGR